MSSQPQSEVLSSEDERQINGVNTDSSNDSPAAIFTKVKVSELYPLTDQVCRVSYSFRYLRSDLLVSRLLYIICILLSLGQFLFLRKEDKTFLCCRLFGTKALVKIWSPLSPPFQASLSSTWGRATPAPLTVCPQTTSHPFSKAPSGS